MAERLGDPEALGAVAANQAVLALVASESIRSGEADAWNPGGWVMRTHPDFTEHVGRVAPDDIHVVYGMTVLVEGGGVIYGVLYGMSALWLRVPSGPAFDDAVAGGVAKAMEELPGWIVIDAWDGDPAPWVRASAALTRGLAQDDA